MSKRNEQSYPQATWAGLTAKPHSSHFGSAGVTDPFSQCGQTFESIKSLTSSPSLTPQLGQAECNSLKSHAAQQHGQRSCGTTVISPLAR